MLDGKGAPHEVLEIINVKIQLKTYPVSIRNFYVLHAFLLMVDNNISTHVMVKPCFQGIEQDIMLKHSKDKIPGFFLTLFLPIFSRCFSSLPRFEIFFSEKTIFLTSVFSPSVPDCGRREWWRWSLEDCKLDTTWSGQCLAQLNHHMSEFVTKFRDQQIKYKVRFKIIQ